MQMSTPSPLEEWFPDEDPYSLRADAHIIGARCARRTKRGVTLGSARIDSLRDPSRSFPPSSLKRRSEYIFTQARQKLLASSAASQVALDVC